MAEKNSQADESPKAQHKISPETAVEPDDRPDFRIVAIGASAGGLDALSDFFGAAPEKTGMAFVVVQHLDPTHPSALHELLKRNTRMSVLETINNVKIEPDHVYIIPPTKKMFIANGFLQLQEQDRRPGELHTIDLFFKSMAEQLRDRAICVILSGTGSDGTAGAKAIKAGQGIVMAQNPETAKYDGMPNAVISAGLADFVLEPERMLVRLAA